MTQQGPGVSVELQGVVTQRRHVIDEETKIGEARREARRIGEACGLHATAIGRASIVVTELARNLLRHGGGGELLMQPIATGGAGVIELLAIDRGRGMQDIEQCLADGYSTAGTPGTGLGAVRRLAAEFDVHSVPGEGTVVMARIGERSAPRFGAVSLALEGEPACGDCWRLAMNEDCTSLMVVDGLGHGLLAESAANAAAEAFTADPFGPPEVILERAHRFAAGTRGVAAACARADGNGTLVYAGIGNISATIIREDASQGLVSHHGILGTSVRRIQQFSYPCGAPAVVVMHSDGISARWDLRAAKGLLGRHPALIAATLYRDHRRSRDDATVVVVSPPMPGRQTQ